MALAYDTSISISGLKDACNRSAAGEVVTIASSEVKRWDINTTSQVGSTVSTIAGNAIAQIGTNRVGIMGFSGTTVAIVDLIALTSTSVTSMDDSPFSLKGQMVAGIPSADVGFGAAFTAGNLIRFDAATPTATKLTPSYLKGQKVFTVIAKGTSGFILATNTGMVIEIDTAGDPIKGYAIPPVRELFNQVSAYPHIAMGMTYLDPGFLLVSTNYGRLLLIDHDTGTILQDRSIPQSNANAGTHEGCSLGDTDSITAIVGGRSNGAGNNAVTEYDMLLTPLEQKGEFTTTTGSPIIAVGRQGTRVWAAQTSSADLLHFADQTGERVTTGVNLSLTDGVGKAGVMTVIDDSGTAQTILETTVPDTGKANVPITDATTILIIGKYGNGVQTEYGIGRRTT